jgi:hypothetical protein
VPIGFFSTATLLYIDGYPRSGNTFAQFLIKKVWPNLETVHHFHAVAAIKIALRRNIPTFILVRDPLNAVASNYLKYHVLKNREIPSRPDVGLLNRFTSDYIAYYRYVERNRDALTVVPFGKLVQVPESVMMQINDVLPDKKRVMENDLVTLVGEIKNAEFGARDKMGSSRPNPAKEMAKAEIISTLEDRISSLGAYDLFLRLSGDDESQAAGR